MVVNNKLFIVADQKEINSEERTIVAWGSKPVIDRDQELIEGDSWRLEQFRKNPVLMLSHDYMKPPIGKVLWVKTTKEGLKFKARFAKTAAAEEIFQLYEQGIMKAFSVGFIPIKWVDNEEEIEERGYKKEKPRRVYTEVELIEISCVSVPSCPDALIDAYQNQKIKTKDLTNAIQDILKVTKPETTENYHRVPVPGEEGKHNDHKIRTIDISKEKGIKALYCVDCKLIITYLFDKEKWTMEEAEQWVKEHSKEYDNIEEKDIDIIDDTKEKGVIPFKETPKAPEDEEWDAGKEVREAEITDLKIMCAWFDSDNPDIKGAYKLPHHRAKDHYVVWRAVAAAMAALLGARGGVNIPSGDRKGVYNHLAKHYEQFDKEPPEFRDYDEAELKELFPEDNKENENGDDSKSMIDLAVKYGELLAKKKLLEEKVKKLEQEINIEDAAINELKYILETKTGAVNELKYILESKTGAVLNRKNKENLINAQKLIQEVLDSAEVSNNNDNEKVIDILDDIEDNNIKLEKDNIKSVDIMIDEKRLAEIIDNVFKRTMQDKINKTKEEIDIAIKKAQGKVM